ncbi:putative sodium-dependent multivitamin transporter [Dermacentor variabilis]|uniref:putative sodium-dependent multivitamin transporter n=1 Tax=Dermacentor variabilis TaxID=34621 RepID=UPI003F5C442A
MVIFYVTTISMTGLALIYWYRDCDPMLVGSITRYDQVVPLYVAQNLATVAGLRGLFLAGLVGASVSTVSSVINSHAATFYTDIVAPHFKMSARQASTVTHVLEATSGGLMTVFSLVVPYMGTAIRVLMTLYSGASGPFAGLIAVAICLPRAKTRGTAAATSIVFALVLWQTVGRTLSGAEPPRMNTTLLRCPQNTTDGALIFNMGRVPTEHAWTKNLTSIRHSAYKDSMHEDSFLLYHLSSYWVSLIAFVATVFLSLVFSFILGDKREPEGNLHLCSPIFIRLWRRLGLLTEEPIDDDVEEMKNDDTAEEMASFLQLKELFHTNASQNPKNAVA